MDALDINRQQETGCDRIVFLSLYILFIHHSTSHVYHHINWSSVHLQIIPTFTKVLYQWNVPLLHNDAACDEILTHVKNLPIAYLLYVSNEVTIRANLHIQIALVISNSLSLF